MNIYLIGDVSLLDKPIVYYVTFGILAQMVNIGCLNLCFSAVICMFVSCGMNDDCMRAAHFLRENEQLSYNRR